MVSMLPRLHVTIRQAKADSMIFKQPVEDIVLSSMGTKYTSLEEDQRSEYFE